MRKANRKGNGLVYRRLAETRMNTHEREQAAHALRSAEAIVDAIVWVKDRIGAVSAMLPRPGFKH